MAERYVGLENVEVERRVGGAASWPAIFAGLFVFLAIEITFGVLGLAILAPTGRWTTASGVWLIVLSIISMYFGARAAGHLAHSTRKLNGLYHGLAVFGVACFTAVVIAALTLISTLGGAAAGAANSQGAISIVSAVQTAGWWLFGALCGAFIFAMIGGASAARRPAAPVAQVPSQRAA